MICIQIGDVLLTSDHVLSRITPHQFPQAITPFAGLEHYFKSLARIRKLEGIDIALGGHEAPMYDLRSRIDEIVYLCEEEGKIVRVPMYLLGHAITTGKVEEFGGVPIYSFLSGPDRALGLLAKRVLDIVGGAIAAIILTPVMLAISAWIALDSAGPVTFRQPRVGLHGRTFEVWKFRTMVADAEERLDDLRDQNEINGNAFKMTNDPRVTRAGRWLRRTSLDELPQLMNVLRGEMSLVGPRPPLASEVAGYDVWHRRRLSMRPGMTGLWQVSARHEPDFDRWVESDLEYIDRWSFWLDLKIIAMTVPAVLAGEGR